MKQVSKIEYPVFHPVLEQGSPEWLKMRIGKFTGSEFYRLMTKPKKAGELMSEGARTYIAEVASERLTGRPAKAEFSNNAMEHGKRWEPIARQTYEKLYGVKVQQVGFIELREGVGFSPDGIPGEDIYSPGLLEIKCPETNMPHMDFLRMKSLKEESAKYYWQVIGGLLCAEKEWVDFVSYSPFFEAHLQFKKYRLHAEDFLSEIEYADQKLKDAEYECQEIIKELQEPQTGLLAS